MQVKYHYYAIRVRRSTALNDILLIKLGVEKGLDGSNDAVISLDSLTLVVEDALGPLGFEIMIKRYDIRECYKY
jgi:hypothetical protein